MWVKRRVRKEVYEVLLEDVCKCVEICRSMKLVCIEGLSLFVLSSGFRRATTFKISHEKWLFSVSKTYLV